MSSKKEHLIIAKLITSRIMLLISLYKYNLYFLTFDTKVILIIYISEY
jgi:hypothetical protein